MTMVRTPAGASWDVRVAWQPRWRLLARRFGGWKAKRQARRGSDLDLTPPGDSGGSHGGGGGLFSNIGDDLAVAIAVIVFMVVAGVLFWFVLLPLLLLVVDAIVVMALFAVGVPTRVLLGRPWRVEASRLVNDGTDEPFVNEVIGWRAARSARDDIAEKLRLGYPPPIVVAGELTP